MFIPSLMSWAISHLGCECSGMLISVGGAGVRVLWRGAAGGGETDGRQGAGQLHGHTADQF